MHTFLRSPVRPLLLGFVGLAALLALVAAPRLGGSPARAQSDGDQSLLLQLAQRLLSAYTPAYTPGQFGGSAPSSVQLFPGALAPDFPSAVPLPSGSTLIGSDERPSSQVGPTYVSASGQLPPPSLSPSPSPSGVHVDVVLDAPGSSADLMSFYKQALTAAGWTAPASAFTGGIGFLSSAPPLVPATYCRTADNASLAVSGRTTDSGPLDVRLSYDTGFSPQCSPPGALNVRGGPLAPFMPPGFGVVPALAPPDGVRVVPAGATGGSANRFTTDAIAVTDMSVADLNSFYAGELTDTGWTQIGSGGDSSLTWSTWSIPSHSDLQGFLYVRNGPADGQRSLHLEVASTDPNAVTANGGYYGVAGAVSTVVNPVLPAPATATVTPAATPAP